MRRCTSILKYMFQGRIHIGYAVKGCARHMANPNEKTCRIVKRIARYLRMHPRRGNHYKRQVEPEGSSTYSDSDWAGCVSTRKSTSGGVIMRGAHVIKHGSRTQSGIALSPGEAELYALGKASSETPGMTQMVKEMGIQQTGTSYTDSSAAKGTGSRVGSGRLKHVETNTFWVQEKAARGDLIHKKVARQHNITDMLTHQWEVKTGEPILFQFNMCHLG